MSTKAKYEESPSLLSRDELLVFNTMAALHDFLVKDPDLSVADHMAAFEADESARNSFMERLLEDAERGYQRIFTKPPDEEQH